MPSRLFSGIVRIGVCFVPYITFCHTDIKETAEKDYITKFANPFPAASKGYIDDIIVPSTTRSRIIEDFATLRGKDRKNPWKKHG